MSVLQTHAGRGTAKDEKPLFQLEAATLRIRDRRILAGTCWQIHAGQQWAVIGPNGSGKSTLVRALCGLTPVVGGRVRRRGPFADPRRIGYVSFELHRHIMAREAMCAEARSFSGRLGAITTAAGIIGEGRPGFAAVRPAAEDLGIGHLLEQDITVLSSGEMRRVLIARALVANPAVLVLDEPFEGLDDHACRRLTDILENLMHSGRQLVLVTHRFEAVGSGISHVVALKNCRVALQGPRKAVMTHSNLQKIYGEKNSAAPAPAPRDTAPAVPGSGPPLVDMRGVTVAYGRHVILDNIDWQVHPGEHWAVLGANGSGKSTLLSLISQDHPQAYANHITLFGRRKGSGETVADLRRHIGVVSSRFQTGYRKHLSGADVVVSGFFDSIGLYRRPRAGQREAATRWLRRLELQDLAQHFFDQLSYGQQRLILIARAVVKAPRILVLDEPCQGLDPRNRRRIGRMLEAIATTGTTLLYATHHRDELPGCISRVLVLDGRGKASVHSCFSAPDAYRRGFQLTHSPGAV